MIIYFSVYNKIKRLYHSNTLGLAIKGEIGNYLSLVGSLIKSRRLIYNKWTYFGFQRAGLEIAPSFVTIILKMFPEIKSVADFGCGTGVYVAEFRKRNVDAEGYEYEAHAKEIAEKLNKIKVSPFDLANKFELNRTFNLSICIEVAEHLVPEMGDKLVDICCKYSDIVVFSAGQPGDGGQGHINEQPKTYWIKKFAERNFLYDIERSKEIEIYLNENIVRGFWVANNSCVFIKEKSKL